MSYLSTKPVGLYIGTKGFLDPFAPQQVKPELNKYILGKSLHMQAWYLGVVRGLQNRYHSDLVDIFFSEISNYINIHKWHRPM